MRLELTRSEVFLELAHTVFSEQARIEPTVRTILTNFLTMIECQRCQILLTDQESLSNRVPVFKRGFELDRADLGDDGEVTKDDFEAKVTVNAAVAGRVAATGRKVNIAGGDSGDEARYIL